MKLKVIHSKLRKVPVKKKKIKKENFQKFVYSGGLIYPVDFYLGSPI